MAMVIQEDNSDNSLVYENIQDPTVRTAALKSCSGEDSEVPAAGHEIPLFRLVAVSFGLLCILQVTLNISLRISLHSQCSSLSEERDMFKKGLETLNWVYFSGSIYYASSIKKSWKDSRDYCRQNGADLMIINSDDEQNFTRQFKKYMWIGLTDLETEGTWKWVDGTPVTKSFWGSWEPNGNTSENCGQTKKPDLKNNWNDEACSTSHYWICEKKVSP